MDFNFELPEPYEYKKITPIEKDIEPVCPTCKGQLKEVPKRKTKCSHCGNFIYLKYSPSNPLKRLVNERENEQIQMEWEEYSQKQSLLQNLHNHGINPTNLQDVELRDYDGVYRKAIEVFINKQDKYKRVCELYYELAIETHSKIIELQNKIEQLTEDEYEELIGEDEYFSYYPFGFIRENYWEATLDYLEDLMRESECFTNYEKAGIENYEISLPTDNNTPPLDKNLDKMKFSVKEGVQALNQLLLINNKNQLMEYRPLLFFNESSQTKILFPPFRLGCRASTIMAY